MKKFNKGALILSLLLILVYACSKKEIDIDFDFPFEITKTHEDIATINYGEATLIRIKPQRNVKDNIYKFSYVINTGTGYFQFKGTEKPLLQDTTIRSTKDNLDIELEFVGTEIGYTDMVFKVFDVEGVEEVINIAFDVIHNPFTVNLTSTTNQLVINQDKNISFLLNNDGKDKNITYKYKAYYKTGIGKILLPDNNGASIGEIEQSKERIINEGVHNYNVKLSELGESLLMFEVEDSNGQVKKDSISFNVTPIEYTFTGDVEKKEIFVNEKANINFNITEFLSGGDTYKVSYEFLDGDGSLTRYVNGSLENLKPAVFYEVNTGAYIWDFLGTIPSLDNDTPTQIKFFARNQSGEEEELIISLNVKNGGFDFNASTASNFAPVNSNVSINFNITESGPTGAPYTLYYETSSNGKLEIGSLEHEAGKEIILFDKNFTASYTGLLKGDHNLTFYITNAFSETITKDVSIVYNEIDYNFIATNQGDTVILDESTRITFTLVSSDEEANYKMYFTESGDANVLLSSGRDVINSAQEINITSGSFSWDVSTLSTGTKDFTFYVVNNTGVTKAQNVSIKVLPIPPSEFTFSARASSNSSDVGNGVVVNFNIIESNAESVYQMTFDSSLNGELVYNGKPYKQGELVPMTSGSTSGVFTASEGGEANINFSVFNDNTDPIIQTDDVNITFENIEFKLATNGEGNIFLNDEKLFNVFLTQNTFDPSIKYTVNFGFGPGTTGTGLITKSGVPIPLNIGTPPIELGGTEYTLKGTAIGIVNLVVTVTDSNGLTITNTIRFNIQNIDFNFSAAAQNRILNIDEVNNINFLLSETAASGTNYQIKYIVQKGSPNITVGGINREVNFWYPISLGNSSWDITSSVAEDIEIEFMVRNTETQETAPANLNFQVNALEAPDFNFSSISPRIATLGDNVPINFSLDETIGTSTYTMTWESSSNGTFTMNGRSYTQGFPIPVTSGNFIGFYSPSLNGMHDVIFTVTNTNITPLSKVDEINIDASNIDFNVSTSGDGSIYENASKEAFVTLTQAGTDSSINYQVQYSIASGGIGAIELYKDGTNIDLGKYAPISIGSTNITVKGATEGTVQILVEIKDNSNTVKSDTINIDVLGIEFEFTAARLDNIINLNEKTPINFNIRETAPSGTNYEMTYVVTKGSATISSGSTIITPNRPTPVNVGIYSWDFTGIEPGVIEVEFTVLNTTTNKTGKAKVEYEVISSDFGFSVDPSKNEIFTSEQIDLNFNITDSNPNTTYKLRYSLNSGFGEVYNADTGTLINPGQSVDIDSDIFTYNLKSDTSGRLTITFYVTDTQAQKTKEVTISVNVVGTKFNFIAIRGQSDAFVNENVQVTLNINEFEGGGDSYEAYYLTSSNGSFKYDGQDIEPGRIFNITALNSIGYYTGLNEGTHNLEFTIINKTDPSKTDDSNISIGFNAIDFSMSVSDTNNTGESRPNGNLIGDELLLNHMINETGGNGNYSISYSIGGVNNPIFSNGVQLESGRSYTVSNTNFNWIIRGDNVGTTSINYTLDDGLGNTFNYSKSVTFVNEIFDFTVSRLPESYYTDTYMPFNIDLSSAPGSLSYLLKVESTNGDLNGVRYGTVYEEDVNFTVSNTFFSMFLNSSLEGVNNLIFTVTASNGEVVSKSISVDFLKRIILLNATLTYTNFPKEGAKRSIYVDYEKSSSSYLRTIRYTNITRQGDPIDLTVISGTGNVNHTENNSCGFLNCPSEKDWFRRDDLVEIILIDSNGTESIPQNFIVTN